MPLFHVQDIFDLFALIVLMTISLCVLCAAIEGLDAQRFEARFAAKMWRTVPKHHSFKLFGYGLGIGFGITLTVLSGYNIAMAIL